MTEGHFMYDLAADLIDLPRSMTGEGNRETLRRLQAHVPLTMHEVPSGTKVYDWVVPPEWEPMCESHEVIIGPDGRGDSYHNRWHENGSLTYGSLLIPGESSKEIFLSCYICHPFQAQDCLSGIVLATALVKWWQEQPRRHTLRVAFVPETLGALCYMAHKTRIPLANWQAEIMDAKHPGMSEFTREVVLTQSNLQTLKANVVAGFFFNFWGM